MKKLGILLSLLFFSINCYAGDTVNPHTGNLQKVLDVQEEDGDPAVYAPETIKFANGSLTDNGDGTVSVAAGAGLVESDPLSLHLAGTNGPQVSIPFDTSYTVTGSEPTGTMYWDSDNHCMTSVYEWGVKLQHGFELLKIGTDEGNDYPQGFAVSATGVSGNRVALTPTDASSDSTNYLKYIGLITSDVDSGNRVVVREGAINGINTVGGLSFGGLETWLENDDIYVDPVNNGYLTNVIPEAPNKLIYVGSVTIASATVGQIELLRRVGTDLANLNDVDGSAPTTTGDLLSYNSVTGVWDRGTYNITDYLTTSDASNTYVPYTGATGAVNLGANNLTIDTNTLFVDATNNRVGIGTATPEETLVVASEASDWNFIQIQQNNSAQIYYAPGLLFTRARGTLSSPSAILNGDYLGQIRVQGYHSGSAYSGQIRLMSVLAKENWASGKYGLGWSFYSVPVGASAPLERLVINADGSIGIPTDNVGTVYGAGGDASIYYNGTNLLVNPKAVGSGYFGILGNVVIGSGEAGVDYTLTFDGETNDGVITWLEDEDVFDLSCGLSLNSGLAVTSILDQDDMSSDSATALATQQSIKAYVDANSGSSPWTDAGTSLYPTNAEATLVGGTTAVNDLGSGGGGGIDANTKLYLPFDQATLGATTVDGALEILDSGNTGHIVTQYGGTVALSTTSKKLGSTSCYFDGTTDYLRIADSNDWNFGSGDFTIEFFWNPSSSTAYDTWIGQSVNSSNLWKFDMGASGTHPRFTASSGGTIVCEYSATDAQTFTNGTWYHIAVVRNGNTLLMFKDGVAVSLTETTTISGKTLPDLATVLEIGNDPVNAGRDINGYMDELRVSKGTARYTTGFTPTTTQFTSDANTVLLLHMDTQDQSGLGGSGTYHIPDFIGTAQLDTAVTKYAGDTTSLLLDGNSDYVSFDNSTGYNFADSLTGDWTIESWIYASSVAAGTDFIFSKRVDANDYIQWYRSGASPIFFIYDGSIAVNLQPATSISATTWEHHAVVKVGSDWGYYINGTQVAYHSQANTATNAAACYIGSQGAGANWWYGNLAHFRLQQSNYFSASPVVGLTDTITVPTSAYSTGSAPAPVNVNAFGTTATLTTNHGLDSKADVLIEGELEVQSNIYLDDNGVISLGTDDDMSLKYTGSASVVILPNLPTSDPSVAGQLWVDTTDGYTIKVSQG